jgi:hypothetical protein
MAPLLPLLLRALRLLRGSLPGGDRRLIAARRRYWDDSVALTLADLVRTSETKASGQVQLLSLADFRSQLGRLWDAYAARILLIAETTIARMIGRGHTFIPQGDDTWLLLFPGMDTADAIARAEAIAAKLGEKLLGAQFTPEEPPLPRTALLDLSGVMQPDGSIDLTALHAAVVRARTAQKPKAAPAPRPRPEAPRHDARLLLRPAWSADSRLVDTFALRALGPLGEDLVADPGAAFTPAVAADLMAAAEALLAEMDARKLRARLVLALPHTLVAGGHDNIRKLILSMPQRLRLMHLRLDVVRLPPRPTLDGLVALRESFRPLVREFGVAVDLFAALHTVFALDHVVFTGDAALAQGWDDTQLGEALRAFRQKAGAQRIAVVGLRSRAQVDAAVAAGVDEVAGPGLMPDLTHLPERLMPLPPAPFGTP